MAKPFVQYKEKFLDPDRYLQNTEEAFDPNGPHWFPPGPKAFSEMSCFTITRKVPR